MALPPIALHPGDGSVAADELARHLDALIDASEVPTAFPAEAIAAAEAAASRALGDGTGGDGEQRVDMTDVDFVTLDPASSTDLDQAMHLSRRDGGFTVLYAIADVPAVVPLGGVIDAEARRRGRTIYLPGRRISLHPEVLSEGAASILPDQDTPALVWRLELDHDGEVTSTELVRAMVRSREKLGYEQVQADIDAGDPHPMMALLAEIGGLRQGLEERRAGASLNLPEQEVEAIGDRLQLTWRAPAPIEDANAQISLMTGMAAAQVMIEGGAGILRTMPPADPEAIEHFRRQAAALDEPWPADMVYGEFLRGLDPSRPAHLALLNRAAVLFRGASYLAFTHPDELPGDVKEYGQAAIGAPYAHTTAPLRRLVDRFVLLTCHTLLSGADLPPELLEALPLLPAIMQETSSRAGTLEREAIDLVEVMALSSLVGEVIEGTVIDQRDASEASKGTESTPARVLVQLQEPPVSTWARSDAAVGDVIHVRVVSADPATRSCVLEDVSA